VAVGGNPCDVLSLLSSLELCCAGSPDCGGGSVYVCGPYGLCISPI
jgi:hypothetical protein